MDRVRQLVETVDGDATQSAGGCLTGVVAVGEQAIRLVETMRYHLTHIAQDHIWPDSFNSNVLARLQS